MSDIKTIHNPTGAFGYEIDPVSSGYAQLIDFGFPEAYGAIGDGNSHFLSERYDSLASAQYDYAFATSLTQEIDYCAIYKAYLNNRSILLASFKTYVVSDELPWDAVVDIQGQGVNSVIKSIDPTKHVFRLKAACSHAKFHNFQVQGAAVTDATGTFGFFTVAGDMPNIVSFTNVLFSGPDSSHGLNNAIKISAGFGWRVQNCDFQRLIGTSDSHGYGVLCGPTIDASFTDNHFYGATGQGRHAIYLSAGASHCKATGNIIERFAHSGIQINCTSAQPVSEWNEIAGNSIIYCGSNNTESGGIGVHGNASNAAIHDNLIIGYNGHGIVVTDFGQGGLNVQAHVYNNKVWEAGNAGIEIIGTKNCVVWSNVVYNSSQNDPGVWSNIDVRSQGSGGTEVAVDTYISGNVCWGTTNRRSININNASPQPTGTIIANNIALPGTDVGINYAGVTDVRLWGNLDSMDGPVDLDLTGGIISAAGLTIDEGLGYTLEYLSNDINFDRNGNSFINQTGGGTLHFRTLDGLGALTDRLTIAAGSGTVNVAGDIIIGDFMKTSRIGVGNSASATTLGAVVKKIQVYDKTGNSLGYVPVYDAIT